MRALAFVRDDHVRGGEQAVKRRRDELLHYWRVSDKFAVPSTIPVERGGARGPMHAMPPGVVMRAFRRVRPCQVMFGSPGGTNSSHHHGFPARLADCSVRNWAAEPLEVNKACWAWCPGTLSMALSTLSLQYVRLNTGGRRYHARQAKLNAMPTSERTRTLLPSSKPSETRKTLASGGLASRARIAEHQTDASSRGQHRWEEICHVERRRAEAYRRQRLQESERPPFALDDIESMVAAGHIEPILARLRELLVARGTICSTEADCEVRQEPDVHADFLDAEEEGPESEESASATGSKKAPSTAFSVCLPSPEVGKKSPIFCEISPTIGTHGKPRESVLHDEPLPKLASFPPKFLLKKACSLGPARRCLRFDVRHISRWWMRLRRDAAKHQQRLRRLQPAAHRAHGEAKASSRDGPPPLLSIRSMRRCAVVMSGHSLRCALKPWGLVLDDPRSYDAVLRANMGAASSSCQRVEREDPDALGGLERFVGARVDFAMERSVASSGRCSIPLPGRGQSVQGNTSRSSTPQCIPDERLPSHPYHRPEPLRGRLQASEGRSGLGLGHSGGAVLSLALGFCNRTDVFGMGLYSDGPGSDLVYQHAYDAAFAPSCHADGARCWRGEPGAFSPAAYGLEPSMNTTVARLARERDARFFAKFWQHVCRPQAPCDATRVRHLPESETGDDFFIRSELRLYVLHSMGLINWIWY